MRGLGRQTRERAKKWLLNVNGKGVAPPRAGVPGVYRTCGPPPARPPSRRYPHVFASAWALAACAVVAWATSSTLGTPFLGLRSPWLLRALTAEGLWPLCDRPCCALRPSATQPSTPTAVRATPLGTRMVAQTQPAGLTISALWRAWRGAGMACSSAEAASRDACPTPVAGAAPAVAPERPSGRMATRARRDHARFRQHHPPLCADVGGHSPRPWIEPDGIMGGSICGCMPMRGGPARPLAGRP